MTLALADPQPERPTLLVSLAAASLALVVMGLLWGATETRTIEGDAMWLKPTKFAVSFLVTFATLALVESRLSAGVAAGRIMRATTVVMAAAFIGDMGWITLQAARGTSSHWNYSSTVTAFAYAAMGVLTLLLTIGISVVGVVAWRDGNARLSPALRRAVGWAFVVTLPLVLATAGVMSDGTGHHVGVHPEDGARVPIVGWSLETGDLRPAHFLALHSMQAVPLWVIGREALGGRPSHAEIIGVTALWSAATLGLLAQALAGYPMF
jgi:hypothetical protein